ncbi:hypothetical protein ASPTUDRAFT_488670 [Aspergillus tubingensis CBS 134.48]|uniref:Secreted protein n=1 Tax=Aspergillus tubingensis (strain CBS 134.48) TaxID=767770 RepID=A0A1L9NC19_ASPTC|nr:hypothetical protein ASPTUDRAFT_488670 [Aspergillus tubingensis CBS 134.48]
MLVFASFFFFILLQICIFTSCGRAALPIELVLLLTCQVKAHMPEDNPCHSDDWPTSIHSRHCYLPSLHYRLNLLVLDSDRCRPCVSQPRRPDRPTLRTTYYTVRPQATARGEGWLAVLVFPAARLVANQDRRTTPALPI